jgi:hypothetical protein
MKAACHQKRAVPAPLQVATFLTQTPTNRTGFDRTGMDCSYRNPLRHRTIADTSGLLRTH